MRCGAVEIEGDLHGYLASYVESNSNLATAKAYVTQAKLIALENRVKDPRWVAKQQRKAKRAAKLAKAGMPRV